MQVMDTERTRHMGWIEVVCGSMFSGKSESSSAACAAPRSPGRRCRSSSLSSTSVSPHDEIVSHSEMRIPSRNVSSSAELLNVVDDDTEVVGSTRGSSSTPSCGRLQRPGEPRQAGDCGRPRPGLPRQAVRAMPQLLAIAEYITKTLAICMVCGQPGEPRQRLVVSSDRCCSARRAPTRPAAVGASIRPCPRAARHRSSVRPGAGVADPLAPCCTLFVWGSWPRTSSRPASASRTGAAPRRAPRVAHAPAAVCRPPVLISVASASSSSTSCSCWSGPCGGSSARR